MKSRIIALTVLTSALNWGEWSVSRAEHFTPRETDHSTHRTQAWVNPRAGLEVMKRES
jgi:hypothetical protein